MRLPTLLVLLYCLSTSLLAQIDSSSVDDPTDLLEQLIEDEATNGGEETDEFEFNAAFDILQAYVKRPLDLNRATYDELLEMLLLTPIQINQLLDYRERMGGFISQFELQVIPSIDLATIRRILPYVRVGNGELDDAKISLKRMLAEGDRELYVRWQRRLERGRGYKLGPDDGRSFYLGSPDRIYTRFRQKYGTKMSFGVTAEKDPGEAFFSENNAKRGFDYYSAHFYLKDINRRVKAVAVGDYTVSFGQGLILYTGFGFGKSAQTTNVARGGQTLRPYTSVSEFNFLRGVATTLAFGPKVELTVFGSRRGRTANLVSPLDTLELDQDFLGVTSLNTTGLNRTPGEVEDRNSVFQTSYGASLRYVPNQRLSLGFNLLGESLSRPLELRQRLYNRFYFRGTDLQNASVDYRYRYRNFTLFGEVAGSDNGATAMLHGLMVGLNRYADFSIVYRNYDFDYQTLNARPFGERSGGRNEEGLYFGVEVRPGKDWRVNAYYDIFRFPYFSFQVNGPDAGHEYRLRVSYSQKRKLDSYVEVRSETRGVNGIPVEFSNLDAIVPRTRFQGRLHFGYTLSRQLQWRSRFDFGFTDVEREERQRGFTILQDLIYKPLGPWSITGRFAVFDTDGFDVRFYQYENGLLYNARIIPLYGRGTRTFLLVRYKGIRKLTLEARVAQTFFTDGREVGTGLEATGGSSRTDVGAQVVWRF
ncbi:ComEA family DNA-binding protein [Neolewinella antarctica]|uniref:Helix-hairpin-helix domain-containing protein n=1 Tax=Neolewinella antarctica TaxID=442734 RepID=A0ABX0X6U3_9BACT|nr:helix-hairpin-helix domain-containing protein [Neolewinella antarctica]NJC24709.1 hypothetical protein [Neolewinella antarctica]